MPSNTKTVPVSRTERIRLLNDTLRCTGKGGRIMLTRGISSLKPATVADLLRAVAAFDAFTPENDPHGEHDCAMVDVGAERVLFKIDYYDQDMTHHSPDPADEAVTVRTMTVMLAEEY